MPIAEKQTNNYGTEHRRHAVRCYVIKTVGRSTTIVAGLREANSDSADSTGRGPLGGQPGRKLMRKNYKRGDTAVTYRNTTPNYISVWHKREGDGGGESHVSVMHMVQGGIKTG